MPISIPIPISMPTSISVAISSGDIQWSRGI